MFSLAFGVGTKNSYGDWLEVYYPKPLIKPDHSLVSIVSNVLGYSQGNQAIELEKQVIRKLSKIAEKLNKDTQFTGKQALQGMKYLSMANFKVPEIKDMIKPTPAAGPLIAAIIGFGTEGK